MIFVLKHNLGKLDTKASDRVIISLICLQNAENVTRNGSVILLPRQRCCWDVMPGLCILVTSPPCHAGRGRGRGGAQFRAIITGQRLAEFSKTTISWSGGILTKNTKHLSQIAVEFIFILPECWNCYVGLGCLTEIGHYATMQRIINGSAQKCSGNAWYEMYWDVLAALMPQLPEQNAPPLIILMNCWNSRNNNGISRQ